MYDAMLCTSDVVRAHVTCVGMQVYCSRLVTPPSTAHQTSTPLPHFRLSRLPTYDVGLSVRRVQGSPPRAQGVPPAGLLRGSPLVFWSAIFLFCGFLQEERLRDSRFYILKWKSPFLDVISDGCCQHTFEFFCRGRNILIYCCFCCNLSFLELFQYVCRILPTKLPIPYFQYIQVLQTRIKTCYTLIVQMSGICHRHIPQINLSFTAVNA